MCVTRDDVAVTLFFCGVVPLVSMGVFLLLLPVYVGVVVWVLHLRGVA
jgi:hypothetical protein